MSETGDQSEPRAGRVIYAVFAQVRGGVAHDFLAAYSSPVRAQSFIDAQDESLKQCLAVWEVEVDRHPSDTYWSVPQGVAGALQALARLPEDAVPARDTTNGGRPPEVTADMANLSLRVAELERAHVDFIDLLQEIVEKQTPTEAVEDICRLLASMPDATLRRRTHE